MSQTNGGQIVVRKGRFMPETCTTEMSLNESNLLQPEMRTYIEKTSQRFLAAILTNPSAINGGMGSDYWVDKNASARQNGIDPVQSEKGIGSSSFRFSVQGKLEKPSQIIRQQGASGADGSFTLLMRDQVLFKNHVVRFPSGYTALVVSSGQGSTSSGFAYNFRSMNGTQFVYSTHTVGIPQCFPIHTAYSEGSIKSDSRWVTPSTFINNMTIQRKTVSLTGSADSSVEIHEYADGGGQIGWMYTILKQQRNIFAAERERAAWWGVSSMKNSDGSLSAESKLGLDSDTNNQVVTGDGFEEQVSGTNTFVGAGTNGEATFDQLVTIKNAILNGSNAYDAIKLVCVTGMDGIATARAISGQYNAANNVRLTYDISKGGQYGPSVDAGVNYQTIYIDGSPILFVVHPMLDNVDMFPAMGNDGKLLSSSNMYFFGSTNSSEPIMEVLCKEANGLKRDFIESKLVGLTGAGGTVVTEADKNTFAMLSETMFNVYNANLCAILYKAA